MSEIQRKYWLSVISKAHIQNGIKDGFICVCHGKEAPLKRMKKGDWIINYSPTISFGGKDTCQAFTAIGEILSDVAEVFDMGNVFHPFRKMVHYLPAKDCPIRPLIDQLDFIPNKHQWGFRFRFGHFEISKKDFELIRREMVRS